MNMPIRKYYAVIFIRILTYFRDLGERLIIIVHNAGLDFQLSLHLK